MIDALPLLLGPEGYQISRSVRLRSSASAYFNRTFGTATNTLIWTWSAWVKRGAFAGNGPYLFEGYSNATNRAGILFTTSEALQFFYLSGGVIASQLITTQIFRDPAAWYHIIVAYDATQATASNRLKFYVNGAQVTAFSTATYPSLNQATWVNTNSAPHTIGVSSAAATTYFDGYLTEINFIDGQALTPSSFGETNPATGVWQPKKYTGTYGTNGFYLNFSDPSAATAAAIGADRSGNGNNWTPNNISVTAGATYDSMLDVPTPWPDGGNGRGNYAVMNPLTYGGTIDNGNLEIVTLVSYASARAGTSTIAADGGKFYWEATKLSGSSTDLSIGVCTDANSIAGSGNRFYYDASGDYIQNGSVVSTAPATYATNDIIGLAVDTTTSTIEFFKNGVSQGSYTMSFAGPYFAQVLDNTGTLQARFAINFGQRPFSYTPPSGFRALNTQNLPTPTILKGNQYFDVTIYTGTAATQNVVNAGAFQPDLVWTKRRSVANSHQIFDSIRGVTAKLSSDTTAAETSAEGQLTSFNTNGFTVPNNAYVNSSPDAFVAWQWKEGATQGFDIVTYTGTGSNTTIAHNLGVAPRMMIVKRRSGASDWIVWHSTFAGTEYIALNTTAAKVTGATIWNSTSPTSSVFSVGTSGATNGNTDTYVAYLFAEVAGFSRFGSYTGNGSADGPFVFTGFRPRWIMLKRTDTTSNWIIIDTERSPYNQTNQVLQPNSSAAEVTGAGYGAYDFLSNGFKPRNVVANETNVNGGTYVYACFAETSFKFSLGR